MFEGAKGAIVLLAGFGLLSLVHHNAQRVAELCVNHLHLNPANRYPRIFIHAASNLTDLRLLSLAGFALTYSILRFIESYGLWRQRTWANWMAIISCGIYFPWEIVELSHGFSWIKWFAFALNLGVVIYLSKTLASRWQSAQRHRNQ